MKHILEADSMQFEFNGRKILSDIYIKLETGKVTALLGRNGQGKSSIMKLIYGAHIYERSVRVDDMPVRDFSHHPHLLRFLPQPHFIPGILSARRVFNDYGLNVPAFNAWLGEFAPKDLFLPVEKLSGGQRRLIELYIIIKSPAKFVMLDEPFTHLSPVLVNKVKDLINQEKHVKGILLTDHLYKDILEICDTLYVLRNGKTHLVHKHADLADYGYIPGKAY